MGFLKAKMLGMFHSQTVPPSTGSAFRLRRVGGSYAPSRGIQFDGLPSRTNIFSSIMVSVMDRTALRARPLPHVQRQSVKYMTADVAPFTARIETVNLPEQSLVPDRFVVQLAEQLRPAHVGNMLSQTMIAQHILHRQVFGIDRLVFADQPCTQLVEKVQTATGNFVMNAGDSQTGLLSVLRSFLFAAQPALRSCELSLVLRRVLRIADLLTVRGSQGMGQSHVNTDLFSCWGHLLNRLVNPQADKILSGGSLRQRYSSRVSVKLSRPFNLETSYFSQFQRSGSYVPGEGRLGIGGRLFSAALFKRRVIGSFLPEVDKGRLQMPQRLLQRYAAHLIQPDRFWLLFQCGQHPICLRMANTALVAVPSIRPYPQKMIEGVPDAAKRARQVGFLLGCGIAAVLKRSDWHRLQNNTFLCKVNKFSQNTAFLPCLETWASCRGTCEAMQTHNGEANLELGLHLLLPIEKILADLHATKLNGTIFNAKDPSHHEALARRYNVPRATIRARLKSMELL